MEYKLLDGINSPDDLKRVPDKEIEQLCEEIRAFLIDKVGKSGGHLASNLGVTELTVAIHRVFNSPEDHIIFDVGHQAYVHKILTGRREGFDRLRKPGGLSGFTTRREGPHDPFGAGHSSTSVSAALGFAESDRLSGKNNYSVCVIGDGAYTGGMAHEAINNCRPDLPLVIILNENGMSISTNKGSFASYLSRVRSSVGYQDAKRGAISFLGKIPLLGFVIKAILSFCKNVLKTFFFKPNYFEQLGFFYIGPIDGNNYKKVEKALIRAKELKKCVILHVKTKKGKGLEEAEARPDEFHSVSASSSADSSYHAVFADELIKLASKDEKILAITAAMGIGTGLDCFEKQFPDRYFDVGIAEGHALTFSAGLAANGYNPFVAIYSTFLQRGYDSIVHDIALQKLPVKMIIDRAGIAPSDGATHHGIFDVSFLSHIPGIEILSPATYGSLRACIDYASSVTHPIAVRYPNASESADTVASFYPLGDYADFGLRRNFTEAPEIVLVTYGQIVNNCLKAEKLIKSAGKSVGTILAERIRPNSALVKEVCELISRGAKVYFVEEGIKNGGAGMLLRSSVDEELGGAYAPMEVIAIDDSFLIPDIDCNIYDFAGLSAERIAERILSNNNDN